MRAASRFASIEELGAFVSRTVGRASLNHPRTDFEPTEANLNRAAYGLEPAALRTLRLTRAKETDGSRERDDEKATPVFAGTEPAAKEGTCLRAVG